jgi:hypothetical protein
MRTMTLLKTSFLCLPEASPVRLSMTEKLRPPRMMREETVRHTRGSDT